MGICISKDNSDILVSHTGSNSDIELFKQPPPSEEDCPICFIQLPTVRRTGYGSRYQSCCGKEICSGCIYALDKSYKSCPFCRTPNPDTEEEIMKRLTKRVEANDPIALYNLGYYYQYGKYGLPQDHTKGMELLLRAGELGGAKAYCNVGFAYDVGRGVEVDKKKAVYYYELAAMKGDSHARHSLGVFEENAGNKERALRHYMISVGSGFNMSLLVIKDLYSNGHASKEEYTKALRAYQKYLDEVKSDQRDEAAAAFEEYKYE